MRHTVGEINGYEVIYSDEVDSIFCKNTTVKYPLIKRMIESSNSREVIAEKSLTVHKDSSFIDFGCLHTTLENCKSIDKNIKKIKKQVRL